MNLKKNFLSLSIKHQISFVIALISILSLGLILALFSLYGNIIISIRYRGRKEYFNERFKLCFESQINFQNFLLSQYEQLMKLFNDHLYYFSISLNDFEEDFFKNKTIPLIIHDYNDYNNEPNEEITDIAEYYKLNFSPKENTCVISDINYDFTKNYIFLYNHLDNIKKLRIPYLGIEGEKSFILKDYLFASLICKNLFSSNKILIDEIKNDSNNNYYEFFQKKTLVQFERIKKFLDDYENGELTLMDVLFPKKADIFMNYLNISEENILRNYYNNISHYFTFIDYHSEKSFYIDNITRFIQQYNLIKDYLNRIFVKIQNFININTIPVYKENNTILSKDLCFAFLYKQIILLNISSDECFSKEKIDSIYNSLKIGETNVEDCILGEKYGIDVDENIKYFLTDTNFDNYYSLKNKRDTTLFKLSGTPLGEKFLGIKYTFPDYSTIMDFNPSFFTLEQLNLYSFSSFHEPNQVINNMKIFYDDTQYFIILLLLYLWIFIYIYLRIRLEKLYGEVIKPINDLNDKISQLDIKEENQLTYEPDDSINELFKLCNELLLGKYKKKLMHESELELEKIDKERNNNYNNLKIDRKIIEQMIENKDQYNNVENDIFLFQSAHEKFQIRKQISRDKKKLNTVITHIENNNIFAVNKDLFNLEHGEENQNNNEKYLNKKNSMNEYPLFNEYYGLLNNNQNQNTNENDENINEMKSAFNYKSLFEITDFVFNYNIEYGRDIVPKKNSLIYKQNVRSYSRGRKGRNRKISSAINKGENRSKNDTGENNSTVKEKKDDLNTKLDEFDKSVISTYNTRNSLFIWYKEAKYFNNVDFLQNDHETDLKDLCKVFLNIDNERKIIGKSINFSRKRNNLKENKIKTLRKIPAIKSGFENIFRKSVLKP